MRCVLDPNVLVAALISRSGTPAKLLRLWREGAFELVVSPSLLQELERVLAYPKVRTRVAAPEAAAFLVQLRSGSTMADSPAPPPSIRSADPNDDYLIALAEATRSAIVSGDKHLTSMTGRLPVYTPAGFYALLMRSPDT